MVIEIKKGSTKEEIDAAFKKLYEQAPSPKKPFNAKKLSGKLKWDIDAVTYQRQLRDEWEG